MSVPPAAPPTLDVAALRPGERVEEYEIQQVLGGGGFGITYLARDTHLDLPVALKEYYPGELVARGPDGRVTPRTREGEAHHGFELGLQRFVDEARALATFRHPNIVRVLRYFRALGTAFIVMEYESGESLKRWLPHHGPLDEAGLLSIVLPLLDGLEAVHGAGFLHRDIKPDNIYVRADGSPVLLDFGAARRVLADGEMTNIVSPGFAPFEQYHSQGEQGPWTDIYSLGAVMYWMVTGRKPLEAAARIQSDGMQSAAALADTTLFSQSLLQAIEWSLQPTQKRRPQSVSQLRATLHASDATRVLPPPPPPPPAPEVPTARGELDVNALQRRTLLCTILFLDLVGYSARSVDDQVQVKRRLNELISRALTPVADEARLIIDTGDGAAVCFLEDPEEALDAALLLRDLVEQRYGNTLPVRVGLHMGPVRIVRDLNQQVNVVGDGINVAQRVMDFAQSNQILVSRAYHDVISRITDDRARMFRYLGPHQDKHGRIHELHMLRAHSSLPPARCAEDGDRTLPLPRPPTAPLDTQAVEDMAADLARRIGPLARVLVAKARRHAHSIADLREALAPLLDDPDEREAFLQAGSAITSPRSRPATDPAAPPREVTRTLPSSPTGPTGPSSPSAPSAGQRWPPQVLEALEQALTQHIGPLARMLVRRQAAVARDPQELAALLAEQVHPPAQREAFRQRALRLLAQTL